MWIRGKPSGFFLKGGLMAKVAKRRGRYVLDFYDSKGKRRWITLPAGTTKVAAKKELQKIEYKISRGTYVPEKRVPTFQEVAESWLEYKKQSVRASTWDGYDGHLRNHFESIDRIKVSRITPAQVEKFISEKLNTGMSIATLRKVLVTFNQVMKYAIRHRIEYCSKPVFTFMQFSLRSPMPLNLLCQLLGTFDDSLL